MTPAGLRAVSPWIELAFLVAVIAIGLVIGTRGRGAARAGGGLVTTRTAEIVVLAAVLLAALLWRTLFYASLATPRWFFPGTTTLIAADALARGDLGHAWAALLRETQVAWVNQSAVMMPVAVTFQVLLGPSIHLPTLIGAFWGVLAVLLAWLLGRAVRSPLFGLLFAALVAASPLQITWARLGGLQIGAVAHVLLVLWLAYLAGARASVLLTLATLAAAWASVYHYYAARVALPLAAVAWLAGLAGARPRARRVLGTLALSAALLGAGAAYAHRAGIIAALWPRYGGYVGNRGERTLGDVAAAAVESVRREIPLFTLAYFWTGRARRTWGQVVPAWEDTALTPGMARGGLQLLPLALLGLAGLLLAVRHPRRDLLWLALLVLGAVLPLLSRTSARRLLIFDLAWCALAASALVALAESRWLSRVAAGRVTAGALGLVLALGTWAFATVYTLGSTMVPEQPSVIPFAENGFNDGITCPECVRRARAWQDEIAAGAAVVLVDGDLDRENRTAPGGLALYGKIAALAAGRPEAFVQYYPLVTNYDIEPPRIGRIYGAARTDFAAELRAALEAARPAYVVWHFARPTQWERRLAERLEAAGAVRRPVAGPPARTWRTPEIDTAFEEVGPAEFLDAELTPVDELSRAVNAAPRCLDAERVGEAKVTKPVVVVAAGDRADAEGAPQWAFAGFHEIRDGDREVAYGGIVAMAADGGTPEGTRWNLLARHGANLVVEPTGRLATTSVRLSPPVGRDCAVWLAGRWWAVDPLTGSLSASSPTDWPLPTGRWIGIGRLGEALVLASAEQFLLILDPVTGREITRFPAVVPPSLRFEVGECTPVVAGAGWVATFDHLTSTLLVWDTHGAARGALRLARLLGLPTHRVAALATHGEYLGVGLGFDMRIVTLRLRVAPECRS